MLATARESLPVGMVTNRNHYIVCFRSRSNDGRRSSETIVRETTPSLSSRKMSSWFRRSPSKASSVKFSSPKKASIVQERVSEIQNISPVKKASGISDDSDYVPSHGAVAKRVASFQKVPSTPQSPSDIEARIDHLEKTVDAPEAEDKAATQAAERAAAEKEAADKAAEEARNQAAEEEARKAVEEEARKAAAEEEARVAREVAEKAAQEQAAAEQAERERAWLEAEAAAKEAAAAKAKAEAEAAALAKSQKEAEEERARLMSMSEGDLKTFYLSSKLGADRDKCRQQLEVTTAQLVANEKESAELEAQVVATRQEKDAELAVCNEIKKSLDTVLSYNERFNAQCACRRTRHARASGRSTPM